MLIEKVPSILWMIHLTEDDYRLMLKYTKPWHIDEDDSRCKYAVSFRGALSSLFTWRDTPEGHSYWNTVCSIIENKLYAEEEKEAREKLFSKYTLITFQNNKL